MELLNAISHSIVDTQRRTFPAGTLIWFRDNRRRSLLWRTAGCCPCRLAHGKTGVCGRLTALLKAGKDGKDGVSIRGSWSTR